MAAPEIGESTKVTLDLKTIGMIVAFVITIAGMWFTLQADIADAKELPANEWNPEWIEKLPPDEVTRMEFQMKDENIRNTIMETRDDVKKLEERMIRMEDKIDKLR